MIKILHTGDVHLDSSFSSLSPRQAEVRRNELRAAFTSMMTYARMNNADLILIAGDMFDGEFVTRETIAMIRREFELFGKPVFIAPGNHDPAAQKSVWQKKIFPDNVFVFTSENVSSFALENIPVTVWGYAFTSSDMTENPLRAAEPISAAMSDRINILLAHGDITGKDKANCPLDEESVLRFGADYTALGHLHNPHTSGEGERWSYCGCLEGRSFDELGPKGACMVEIEKKNGISSVSLKRVRFSKRRYEKDELRVDGCETQADIKRAISDFIFTKKYGEDTCLSLRLTGYIPQSLMIDTDSLEEDSCGLFLLKVADATSPDVNFASLENDLSIRGEVYRQLKGTLLSSDEREREVGLRALRYALSALSGENIV
ncbi:MAG: DNA repair exonuclease [Ruminococcaceae bacterium]|nr:DNA repair exonuclease [Oscillospiraceae bacterium]